MVNIKWLTKAKEVFEKKKKRLPKNLVDFGTNTTGVQQF